MSDLRHNLRQDQTDPAHTAPLRTAVVPPKGHAAQSYAAMVAAAVRASLLRLSAFLGGFGGHQFQPVPALAFGDGLTLGLQVAHREIHREAEVEREGCVGRDWWETWDELGPAGLDHSGNLLAFSAAGAAERIDRPTRVTAVGPSAAPCGGNVGRPIGSSRSGVPEFTARRRELGLSLETIAARITLGTADLRGVQTSFQAVSAWEAGEHLPGEERVDLLAQILGVDRATVEGWFLFSGSEAHDA